MEEARAVLDRLEGIEALERAGAPAAVLLEELRALVGEAEEWVRSESSGTARAAEAVNALQASLQAQAATVGR